MVPTPYPELNAVLQELVQSVQAVLRDNFVAACLQGSFAVGDFDRHSFPKARPGRLFPTRQATLVPRSRKPIPRTVGSLQHCGRPVGGA